jgi:peptide/nickel transport system substrate-binding protein
MARLGWLFNNRLNAAARAQALGATVALGMAVVLALSACGTSAEPTQSGPQPQRGGTLYLLASGDSFDSLDPTTVYNGNDWAFFGATLMRSLVSYTDSPDPETADTLQPDLATDTGTPNADTTQWTFTLRDGPKWQDGSPITCADIKYGISREFAEQGPDPPLGGGPTYAMVYLDIPAETDQAAIDAGYISAYHGPYDGTGQDLYDRAVVCDANTITFHLNRPVADFNYATMLGMYPVKQSSDTGLVQPAADGSPPPNFLSSGPYQIESYTTGVGGKMILERNPNWDPSSDPVRKALPDRWEVDFGLDALIVDQRLMASSGDDAMAVMYDSLQPQDVPTVFADPQTANPAFAGRAFGTSTTSALYLFINTRKLTNMLQRQAIAVALDRQAFLSNSGPFSGDLADGVIPPSTGVEYAPTGWATDLFGEPIPPAGNPDLARRLIEQSGAPMPPLTLDYHADMVAPAFVDAAINSLALAGIQVTPNPIVGRPYWPAVQSDEQVHEFGGGAWGPDWPNASTIIPPLFTPAGGWDLSRVDDQGFTGQVQDALTTLDRTAQAAKWQDLNKEAMHRAYVVPLMFVRTQMLAGTRVGPLYLSAWYGTWPFAEMGVLPE